MEWVEQSLQRPDLLSDDQHNVEEVRRWHFGQSKLVEHCLTQPGAEMLAHVGTTATTRDLLAMADAFDGPGSPVNFWGMSYGSLVGTQLLRNITNTNLKYLFEGIARHSDHQAKLPNITDIADFLAMISSMTDESLGLGVMPIFCGDKLLDHNATATQQDANTVVQALARDRARAPALASDAFPALHYLCHLWPVRAAERYPGTNDTAAFDTFRPGPAHPHVQITNQQYSLTSLRVWVHLEHLEHWHSEGLSGPRSVSQVSFGVRSAQTHHVSAACD
ncbi:hypothetical protein TRAPUB_2609 [Trametes pubescens]|uniref:Uncharacterized protein n=1 Tax=Trametes pubescens TaxID=154538 RepID=A0A1M2VFZ6_TRAPU|nr:hypothetical protein TRAPUB_2609 [Trametes pubescens]